VITCSFFDSLIISQSALKKEAETLVFSTPKNVKIAKTNIYV